MKKYFLCLICLISFNAFAHGKLTDIRPGVTLYSEYYPNSTTKFKGTIVFENGSGTAISEWKGNKKFFMCVKKLAPVFLYDRNGLGKSPPDLSLSTYHPLTAKLVSNKLLILLHKRHIKPPYVFVVHSYGAMYGGYFILKNPHLVKGVIMVDPVPRDYHFKNQILNKYKKGVEAAKMQSTKQIYRKYKKPDIEVFYQILGFEQSKESVKRLGNIGESIPVVIISAIKMDKKHPIKENWYESQKQWLNKNSQSRIFQVSTDHFVQLEKPKLVCNEIAQMLR